MKRYSRQREVILKVLQNRTDHPTADMIYNDVKKELPQIGIATVYRNLADLTKEGQIVKLKTRNNEADRFDGNIIPHIHFECDVCNKVYDIFPEDALSNKLDDNIKQLADLIHAKVISKNVIITGICNTCKN